MILMVQSSVMDIRKSNVLALCVLSMILLLLSCKQRLVEKDVIAGISDSICFQNALINHIKYLNRVKSISLEGIDKSGLLVYRYCDENCDKCVEEDLQILFDFQEKIGKSSVLVVSSFPENLNTNIRLRNELRNFNYRNIVEKEDMPINEDTGLAMRFFTYYPKDESVGYIFFPISGRQDLTNIFFNFIYSEIKNDRND